MTKSWRPWVAGALICAGAVGNAHSQDSKNQPGGPAQDTRQQEAMAESIIAGAEAAAGRAFDSKFRAALNDTLAARSLAELASTPPGLIPRALGDSATDLVYTPVAPCRIIDTRLAGGPILPGTPRNFFVAAGGLTGQGGGAGSCGVPFGPATSVFINFVAVGPAGPGNLRAFAFGAVAPNASIINYSNVPGLNIANGLAVPICNPAVSACIRDLTVIADVSPTDLVADVVGFFAAPAPLPTLWAVVDFGGALGRNFHATSATNLGLGIYEVIFDRNVSNCAYNATIGDQGVGTFYGDISAARRSGNANGVFVLTSTSVGVNVDLPFHLVVHC